MFQDPSGRLILVAGSLDGEIGNSPLSWGIGRGGMGNVNQVKHSFSLRQSWSLRDAALQKLNLDFAQQPGPRRIRTKAPPPARKRPFV